MSSQKGTLSILCILITSLLVLGCVEISAFLMDEPIGALDADARETMRAEIKQFHIELNATTVYVTHDQVEAMAMGDRIVVMSEAVVQQVCTPAEVYYKPANLFVAGFIGSPGMNLIPGQLRDGIVYLPEANRCPLSPEWIAAVQREIGDEGGSQRGDENRSEGANAGGRRRAGTWWGRYGRGWVRRRAWRGWKKRRKGRRRGRECGACWESCWSKSWW